MTERVLRMTERVLRMTVDSVWPARRSFATLRMTERVQNDIYSTTTEFVVRVVQMWR